VVQTGSGQTKYYTSGSNWVRSNQILVVQTGSGQTNANHYNTNAVENIKAKLTKRGKQFGIPSETKMVTM
jgi:hypothetical protein